MNTKSILIGAAIVIASTATASAAVVFKDLNGNTVSLGGAGYSIDEQNTSSGGTYTLNNNTGGIIWGFGVTNSDASTFAINNSFSGCCGDATNINELAWDSGIFAGGGFGNVDVASIIGSFATILGDDGPGGTIHYYDDVEVGYGAGTHTGFDFIDGNVDSNTFAFLQLGGEYYVAIDIEGGSPVVPLPAGGLLLLGGLGAFGAMRRKG